MLTKFIKLLLKIIILIFLIPIAIACIGAFLQAILILLQEYKQM